MSQARGTRNRDRRGQLEAGLPLAGGAHSALCRLSKPESAVDSVHRVGERYGRNVGVSEGYEQLRLAVIAGEFERSGRCRVLYLHPGVVRSKMTRGMMANITATFPAPTIERQFLGCCWIPRDLAIAWCVARNVSVAGWFEGSLWGI